MNIVVQVSNLKVIERLGNNNNHRDMENDLRKSAYRFEIISDCDIVVTINSV